MGRKKWRRGEKMGGGTGGSEVSWEDLRKAEPELGGK